MKKVLALQHVPVNPPGLVGQVLMEYGIAVQIIHVTRQIIPDPHGFDAVIAFGGTQHIYDEKSYPFSLHEDRTIKEVIERDIPFLGICYGSQLLAHALQGQVSRMPRIKIGFVKIAFTEEGKRDPLYAGLPGYQQAFQWHDDHFQVPTGGVLLATSDQTSENQAFRYGSNAYGLQYHIELTPEMMGYWLHEPSMKQELIQTVGEQRFAEIEQERQSLYTLYNEHAQVVIKNFMKIAHLI